MCNSVVERSVCTLLWLVILIVGVAVHPSAAAASSEYETNLELSYKKLPDERRQLKAVVTATKGDRTLPVENMLVNFFVGSVGREGGYGNVKTDKKGEAVRILDAGIDLPVDEEGKTLFIARSKHPSMPLLEDRVAIEDASIEIEADEADSKVKARLVQAGSGSSAPIPQVKVNFGVVRSFGNIPFGGDFTYTGEQGEVSVDFPTDIPKDATGKVTVIASLEAHDEYGTVVETFEVPWGRPAAAAERPSPRALWASRSQAPWWLLISVGLLLFGVWGTILWVLYLTRKIKEAA